MTEKRSKPVPPQVAGILAWIVPGLGHLALGKHRKALLFFVLIMGTLLAGWLISDRENVYFERGRWHAVVQVCAGVPAFALGVGREAPDPRNTVMTVFEIGTLYTMVAGLLNLLVIMDAVMTSLRLRKEAS